MPNQDDMATRSHAKTLGRGFLGFFSSLLFFPLFYFVFPPNALVNRRQIRLSIHVHHIIEAALIVDCYFRGRQAAGRRKKMGSFFSVPVEMMIAQAAAVHFFFRLLLLLLLVVGNKVWRSGRRGFGLFVDRALPYLETYKKRQQNRRRRRRRRRRRNQKVRRAQAENRRYNYAAFHSLSGTSEQEIERERKKGKNEVGGIRKKIWCYWHSITRRYSRISSCLDR